MNLNKNDIKLQLTNLLNECLESYNQEYSFKIEDIDLKKQTGTATFKFCIIDRQAWFNGY